MRPTGTPPATTGCRGGSHDRRQREGRDPPGGRPAAGAATDVPPAADEGRRGRPVQRQRRLRHLPRLRPGALAEPATGTRRVRAGDARRALSPQEQLPPELPDRVPDRPRRPGTDERAAWLTRGRADQGGDRKSTRLNSSHVAISYA